MEVEVGIGSRPRDCVSHPPFGRPCVPCCSCQPSESLLTIRRSATTLGYTPGGSGRQRIGTVGGSVWEATETSNAGAMRRPRLPSNGALTLSLAVCTATETVGIFRILAPPPRFPATSLPAMRSRSPWDAGAAVFRKSAEADSARGYPSIDPRGPPRVESAYDRAASRLAPT